MYCRQLGIYVNHPTTKYNEEYEALKEWGCIVREFEK